MKKFLENEISELFPIRLAVQMTTRSTAITAITFDEKSMTSQMEFIYNYTNLAKQLIVIELVMLYLITNALISTHTHLEIRICFYLLSLHKLSC